MKRIALKKFIVSLGVFLLISPVIALAAPTVAGGNWTIMAATCKKADSTPSGQVLQGVGAVGGDCTDAGVTGTIKTVVRILSVIVGVAAVIMIIYGGFKYITSAGDSSKVSSAKSTLVYAIVGLVVAASAQLFVNLAFGVAK